MTTSGQKVLIAKDGSWSKVEIGQELDDNGDLINKTATTLDAFSAPKTGKYPLTVEESANVSNLLESLSNDEAQLLVNIEFFKDKLAGYEKEKDVTDKKNRELRAGIEENIDQSKKTINLYKKRYKKASNNIKLAKNLLAGKAKNKQKSIDRLQENVDMPIVKDDIVSDSESYEDEDTNIDTDDSKIKREGDKYTSITLYEKVAEPAISSSYSTSFELSPERVMRTPHDCKISYDGYDEGIRAERKEVAPEFFFGYTQEKMKSYFKDDNYITCNANLSKVGKNKYITLEIRIKSKDAKKNYGTLQVDETMRITLVDGSKVYCKNVSQSNGEIEPYSGHTIYKGIYLLEKQDYKKLKEEFVDNIGIFWTSGFEEYTIYEVDFFKIQSKCLEK